MRALFCKMLACFLLSLLAVDTTETRAEEAAKHAIDKKTLAQQKKSQPVFKTLPSVHVTPGDDKLVMSVSYTSLDLHSDYLQTNELGEKSAAQSLRLNGYGLTPMLAITGRHIGIGVSAELGEGQSKFQDHTTESIERGVTKYNGVGLHTFYNPMPDAHSFYITANASGKVLNVSQKTKQYQDIDNVEPTEYEWNRFDYKAYRTQLGLNMTLKPTRSFAIIPWAQVSHTTTPALDQQLSITDTDSELINKERYAADADYIMQRGTRVEYGIDLSVLIKRFEIHFGNAIGSALASRQRKNDELNYRDRSLTLGVTLQTDAKRSK